MPLEAHQRYHLLPYGLELFHIHSSFVSRSLRTCYFYPCLKGVAVPSRNGCLRPRATPGRSPFVMLVSAEEPVEGSYELTGAFDGR